MVIELTIVKALDVFAFVLAACAFLIQTTGTPTPWLEKWSHRVDNANPLFFIKDKLSDVKFSIDTGATCSLFPASQSNVYSVQPIPEMSSDSLPVLGGGYMKVKGSYCTNIDLGLSRLLPIEFLVANFNYGIIGADLLTKHHLIVDLSA